MRWETDNGGDGWENDNDDNNEQQQFDLVWIVGRVRVTNHNSHWMIADNVSSR